MCSSYRVLIWVAVFIFALNIAGITQAQTPATLLIESDDARVVQSGTWSTQATDQASAGSYLYSTGAETDVLVLAFEGSAVEVIYIAGPQLGTLAIEVDGTVLRTVITAADQTAYRQSTIINYLSDEPHTLKVYAQAGGVIAIDAFVVSQLAQPSSEEAVSVVNGEENVGTSFAPCGSPNIIHRVTVDSSGQQGNGNAYSSSLSADGRFVTFVSAATNLVAGDTNGFYDVFVYDHQTCATTRVSVGTGGVQSNYTSLNPSISGDGRYVVFESYATNLVSGDTNELWDVFLHDRQTATTTLISVVAGGAPVASGHSRNPMFSSDGRYIAFESGTSFVAGDTNNTVDIYVYDRQTTQMTRVSVATGGTQGNDYSSEAQISGDGRYVAFLSSANNLVSGDTNQLEDIFVHDRQTATTTRVSVDSSGAQGNDFSSTPAISADGRYIAYSSYATNLVIPDATWGTDIYVYDQQTHTTTRASISLGVIAPSWNGSYDPALSGDGRYVVFSSSITNLVPNDTNGIYDIFVYDRQTATTTRLSNTQTGEQANGGSSYVPAISGDGRFVAFESFTPNLVPNDTNAAQDIFVRSVQTAVTLPPYCASTFATHRVSVDSQGVQANEASVSKAFSVDGRYVLFNSSASNLVANDTNGQPDAFVYDRQTCTTSRVSVATGGVQASGGGSYGDAISNNGRYVVFTSNMPNVVPNDTNSEFDVFVHDRQTLTTTRVSVGTGGIQGNAGSSGGAISPDGRYVVFNSFASNLVAGDTWDSRDVFVHDRHTGETTRVSVGTGGTPANWDVVDGSISANGRYVAFSSRASNLVAGDTNDSFDVFVHDRQTVTTRRISLGPLGVQGNDQSSNPVISADGHYVVFESYATNLVNGDTNGVPDIFVYDLQSITVTATTRVSRGSNGVQGNGASTAPAFSADGRYIAFLSAANNFLPSDANGTTDLFVHDQFAGLTVRASVSHIGGEPNYFSSDTVISPDGRYVAFASRASNLVTGDTNGAIDVFVNRNLLNPTPAACTPIDAIHRVSLDSNGFESNNASGKVSLSADGRFVAFESTASNLIVGDTNGFSDIFVFDRQTCAVSRVSVGAGGVQANFYSFNPAITPDGRYITFESRASNLVAGDTNGAYDIFVYDRLTGTTTRASIATGGGQSNNTSTDAVISADGRFVAFESYATNLVSGDTNALRDVFVHDRQTSTTTRVSVATGGAQATGMSLDPAISADGRLVAFHSNAPNLVAGDTDGRSDVFVHDRQTATTTVVSVATGGTPINDDAEMAAISADGRFVAFVSDDNTLVAGDTNATYDIFVHDRQTNTTTRASVATGNIQANGPSQHPAISADGRYVAFQSQATNLTAGDANGFVDIFVHDRLTNTTNRVSIAAGGTEANNASHYAAISGNGQVVAFQSIASLTTGDTNGVIDIFVSPTFLP